MISALTSSVFGCGGDEGGGDDDEEEEEDDEEDDEVDGKVDEDVEEDEDDVSLLLGAISRGLLLGLFSSSDIVCFATESIKRYLYLY